MNSLHDILLSRYQAKKLASFYILKNCTTQEDLEKEYYTFLGKVLIEENCAKDMEQALKRVELGHPDLLELKPSDKHKDYTQADFVDFFRFQDFAPIELAHRFILVHQAERINNRMGNKLLKTLEEPRPDTTILFIVPQGFMSLPTINSRAITLTHRSLAPTSATTNPYPMDNWLKSRTGLEPILIPLITFFTQDGSIQEVLTLLKGKADLQKALYQACIDWQGQASGDFTSKSSFLDTIKDFEQSQAFRNPPTERLFQLLVNTKTALQNCQK